MLKSTNVIDVALHYRTSVLQ